MVAGGKIGSGGGFLPGLGRGPGREPKAAQQTLQPQPGAKGAALQSRAEPPRFWNPEDPLYLAARHAASDGRIYPRGSFLNILV